MSERNESGRLTLSGLLIVTQIVLIVLKLTKVIDGEWLYICIPSIVLGGIVVLDILLAIIICIIDYFD